MSGKHYDSLTNFQVGILKRHNYHRQRHHVAPLFWNGYLAKKAQEICEQYKDSGEKMEKKKEVDFMFHTILSIPDVGQNIHLTTKFNKIQPYEIVDDWYSSCKQYDYTAAVGNVLTDTFTQLVWRNTVHIGVQSLIFNNKKITVALYSPKGNIVGEYDNNVFDPDSKHKPTTSTFSRPPIVPYSNYKYHLEDEVKHNLIRAINRRRVMLGYQELSIINELEEKSQQTAELLVDLWVKLDHSPDITLKTQDNHGMVIAFVPRRAVDVDWIIDHWSNIKQLPHRYQSDAPNPAETSYQNMGTMFLSQSVKSIGIGFAINSVACIVCLFAPVHKRSPDFTITYYKHTKYTKGCDSSCHKHS